MVVVGGRAPQNRWGTGALQELDQPPIFAPRLQAGPHHPHRRRGRSTACTRRSSTAGSLAPRPGLRRRADGRALQHRLRPGARPSVRRAAPTRTPTPSTGSPRCWPARRRPVLILGTDVWADRAEEAALRFVEAVGVPTITNGMGRGVVPGGHPLLVTKARGQALGGADLVVVVGTPLDFRLGYGVFGGKDGADPGPGRARRRLPRPALRPRRARRRRSSGDLTVGPRRPARRRSSRSSAGPTGPPGSPTSRPPSRPRPSATPRCSAPRPTRSTRPASTASWCRGWPTTPS